MKKGYIYIKLSLLVEKMRRHHSNVKGVNFFASKGCKLRKPLFLKFNNNNIELGRNVTIDLGARIDTFSFSGRKPKIVIGDNTMISFNFSILCAEEITIGNNCLIASNVFICDENHGINPESGSYISQKLQSKPIHIGSNCWIGERVSILPGVSIGDNCIIGTGALVSKSIPDNSIAVGNPCKVIKKYDFNKHLWIEVEND